MLRLSEKHMNYSNQQRIGIGRFVLRCLIAGSVFAGVTFAGLLQAAGEVTEIHTSDQLGIPSSYTIDGRTFSWGMGQNQIMDGFTADSVRYSFASTADRVELVRHDVHGVSTGNPCGVFVERLGTSSEVLKANYPSDGSGTGNCDMAAMIASRVVNRGALNLFSNIGPNPKNVERVDYLYDRGVLAPLTASSLSKSGHVVAEKSGNNPLQIAAITSVNVLGQPTSFGPLVFIERNGCTGHTVCYGITNLRHNYSFFHNNSLIPQGYPSFIEDSTEPVGMAFVSLDQLGLSTGQIYYGFSYFAADVDSSVHTLTDVTTFPQDTQDEKIVFGDGPDIYGGVSGYFLADTLNVASGSVFNDENGDGHKSEDEAGISDIGLTLFQDTNGDGVFDPTSDSQLGPSFDTDINGNFTIPGLEDGVYFLQLDESDPDLPPGISVVPGTNPMMIVISGGDVEGIGFGFIGDADSTAGAGDDAGTGDVDAGGTAGSTDAGSDAGSSDAGSGDAGTDAGSTTTGTVDSGSADAGVFSDIDADGVEDFLDNCPSISNADQIDTDQDGFGDVCDDDDDNDGVADESDVFPTDASESIDTDGDGIGNNADTDDDGDAQSDADELACGSNPLDVNSLSADTDADGIPDCVDTSDASADAGSSDAGADAGASDAGASDAGADAGASDAGSDAGASDAGADAGASDAGSDDAGATDAGSEDDFIIINDGVNVTMANPDSVTVNHGSSATIDVLANDSDAAGQGLTIISTSESANASIVIQDGVIIYSPEFGFHGMDPFMYVIEDGAGTQDTGTVSVNVLRFSDINNNGLNDFDECECDNLTIEVGVEGSALGGSSLLSFMMLWLIYCARRMHNLRRDCSAGVEK